MSFHVLRYIWKQWHTPKFFPYYILDIHIIACTSSWKRITSWLQSRSSEVWLLQKGLILFVYYFASLLCWLHTIFWANNTLSTSQPIQFLLLEVFFLLSATERVIFIVQNITQILHTSVNTFGTPGGMIYSFLYIHIITLVNLLYLLHLFTYLSPTLNHELLISRYLCMCNI